MPQQAQTSPAQASEDSVKAFMELDEGGQSRALAGMSPDAKRWLLLGVKALRSTEPASTPQKEDRGILAGVTENIVGTAKGIKGLFAPATEDDPPTGEKIRETYRQGGRQAKEQFQSGVKAIRAGSPVEGGLQVTRAGVTAASLADPFAAGSVVNLNQMQDEGRYREALGTAAFDVLTLWAGKKVGGKPSTATKINKLTSAIGETGETVKNLERVLPEIEQTAKRMGKPGTIGAFADNVRSSLSRLQSEFDAAFNQVKSRRAYTPVIKNHIDRIVRENPNLMQTPEGRAEVASLRRIQRQYDRPWTLEDMNLERSRLRKQIRSLYDAKPTDAAAKMKLDAELRAKKVVADSFSETVNDHLAHVTGKDRFYWDVLRQKQESFMDLNDHLDSQVEKLRDKQAAKAGKTIGERLKPHAYASAGGPRVHVPFGEAVPSEGASDLANRKVRQAFGPTKAGRATRAAILALPLSHLTTAGEDVKQSRMTPPPAPEE
jgi:hypothetical protein